MKLKNKLAAVVPFAHLLGIRAESETDDDKKKKDENEAKRADWAKKAESDDDRKQKDGESDDDYAKRMEEMDDEEDKKAKGDKKDGDGSEGLEDDSEEAKAVRQSERARCAKIIAHGIKNGCVNQAGVFAFDTSMTAAQAIASLNAAKLDVQASRPGLAERMASASFPRVGADAPSQIDPNDPQSSSKVIAQQVIAAAAKARGEKV